MIYAHNDEYCHLVSILLASRLMRLHLIILGTNKIDIYSTVETVKAELLFVWSKQ